MGESSNLAVGPGEAVRISTGGMLPTGADSVVMVEHTEAIDDTTIEVYRSVAPGQNMVEVGEDVNMGEIALTCWMPHPAPGSRYAGSSGPPGGNCL